jgi:hypothetical protein
MSDFGFAQTPGSAKQLALNLGAWFAGGRPGRFLVYSGFSALAGNSLAATMRAAGHTWTIDPTVPFTLETLLQYDAVFVGGGPQVDNTVLIDYVRAGGGVFVEGGTGLGGDPWEARHWNTFLQAFGLAFSEHYDMTRAAGTYAISSTSPLFAGVTALYEQTGSPIFKLDASDPKVQVLVPYNGHALYAAYSARVIPVAVEICDRPAASSNGAVWVNILGGPDFDVRTIDPGSVRVVKVKPFTSTYNFTGGIPAGRRLGRTRLDGCLPGGDTYLDLGFAVHSRDLMSAIQGQGPLGHALYDGDYVGVIVTGSLKPEFGGTPIVGESIVSVRGLPRPAPFRSR